MKPGIKTTEFWISALTTVGAVGAAAVGFLPATAAATVATISGGAYALARGLAKLFGK